MMRLPYTRAAVIVLAVGCLTQGGCAGLPRLDPGKPHAQPAPTGSVCPGGLSAPLLAQPQPPAGAGMVKAQTQAESDAQAASLTWIHDLACLGQGWLGSRR